MASPAIKPLDGPDGYLRWKESLLLRAHTLGVARVLFEDPPTAGGGDEEAAKKWVRDDAICRGHILAALSDRLLPDYARHATAGELWRALQRTYDVEVQSVLEDRFNEFCFDQGGHFLEQLAHAEALGLAAGLSDGAVASGLRRKLPEIVGNAFLMQLGPSKKGMSLVWEIAHRVVSGGIEPELLWKTTEQMAEDSDEDQEQGEAVTCWNCGEPGHFARNCNKPGHIAKKCRRRA